MRFPFPTSDDFKAWAYELIFALEAPNPAEDEYYRERQNSTVSSATYTVTRSDYLLLVDTSLFSVSVTLPPSKNDGWEYEIVKTTEPNRLIILPTGSDTLVGETSIEVDDQWTALKLRAVLGGYVIV